ncbi:MAG: DUF58 domain-containing protein [Eubacteriales bacterium]
MSEKKNKKAKYTENVHRNDRLGISLTYRFGIWLCALVGCLIFTQALRAPASNVMFGFCLGLPFVSFLYALASKWTVKLYLTSDTTVTEKLRDFSYEFRIINEGILPYPFVDAYIKLPRRSCVRTSERCVRVSMAPLSNYTVKGNTKFRFRGTYEIGVSTIYVYDFLRIFRIRIPMETYSTVYVLPRKLTLNTGNALSVSDSAMRTVKAPYVYDKLEVFDIRDYRPGDSLKSIHWKLSSKSEEFIVNDYNTGSADISYIFCDMSAHFPDEAPEMPFVNPFKKSDGEEETARFDEDDPSKPNIHTLVNDEAYEDMNEFCADGAVELTVAVVLRELRSGRDVTLMWYDDRSVMGAFRYDLHTVEDFDLIYRLFTSAPTVHSSKKISRLAASAGDTKDAKVMVVLPVLDDEVVNDVSEIPRITEIVAYSAEERFLYPELRRSFIEHCREQFSAHGIKLIDGKLSEDMILYSESPLKDGEEERGTSLGFGLL